MRDGRPSALRRAAAAWAGGGPAAVWFGLLGVTFYRRLEVYVRELDGALPDFPCPEGIRIAPIGSADDAAWRASRPDRPGALAERLAAGGGAWGAWDGAGLVHAAFFDRGGTPGVPFLGCRVALADDEVLVHDAWTTPAWRGRGVSPARLAVAYRAMRAAGCTRAYALVLTENHAARAVPLKAGALRCGTLRVFGLAPWRRSAAAAARTVVLREIANP